VKTCAGLALVTSNGTGPYTKTVLVAVDPVTGRIQWRFDPGSAVSVLAHGPAGLAVATDTPGRRLYLLDPRTGWPRWRAATVVALGTVPLVTATRVVAVEGGVAGYPAVRLVSRDSATGRQLWAHTLATIPAGPQPVLRLAGQAIVQTAPPRAHRTAPLLSYDLATGRPGMTACLRSSRSRRSPPAARCSSSPPSPATRAPRPDRHLSRQKRIFGKAGPKAIRGM
jgi:hypothetical protein